MFNTDPTLRPSKMGPQAPAANLRPPSTTVTARAQVQTNKFFPLEMPDPARIKQQPAIPSKKTKEEDEDGLPVLVGETAGTANGAPATPFPKAPTVKTTTGTVTIEEAEDDDNDESELSLFSHLLF